MQIPPPFFTNRIYSADYQLLKTVDSQIARLRSVYARTGYASTQHSSTAAQQHSRQLNDRDGASVAPLSIGILIKTVVETSGWMKTMKATKAIKFGSQ